MSLAEALGLPHEEELPDDEEIKSNWLDILEERAAEMIGADVVVALSDWSAWTVLERGIYKSLKEQMEELDIDEFVGALNLEGLGNFEEMFKELKEAAA